MKLTPEIYRRVEGKSPLDAEKLERSTKPYGSRSGVLGASGLAVVRELWRNDGWVEDFETGKMKSDHAEAYFERTGSYRATVKGISRMTGLSSSAVSNAIKRLGQHGYVTRFVGTPV